ncbi:MAG: beta-galactosidase trimerization domain-containing protein, partial [Armatimonadetes bacterium]|nr:beta-galactosidase trimerization domain-containing protein [Armatimonadota bacterium]
SLGDENHTRGACQHPACLAAYRDWLRGQYRDIAALNASWDSDYASFDEINLYKPGDLNEQAAFNDGHYARWYDRQAFKRYNYAVYCGRYARAFEAIDPQAITGFEGAGRFGDDYDECIARVGFWGPYPSIGDDIIRSLAPPELITSNWMGYRREADPMVQRMWRMISNRCHGVWWWRWDNIGRFHGFLAPDLHPWDDTSQPVIDEMADIRDGVGTWILKAEMPHDGIGLLYSMPSAFAGGRGPRRGDDLDMAHQGFLEVVQDLGYAAHYLSDRTVAEENDLNDGDERVLLLPMGRAIPDAVAEQIRRFVRDGGLVIADMRPGIRDGHCKLREAGVLDDVFGIHQTPAELQEDPEYVDFTLTAKVGGEDIKANLSGGAEVVENVGDGEALGEVNGLPGVIVNHYGEGVAVLLNFPFSQYLALRREGEEMPLRRLIGAILEMADVHPPFTQRAGRGPLRATETVRWISGDVQLVMLFKTAGEDGPATTVLPEPMHVYDLRRNRYLGRVAKITAPLRVGYANLYALSPESIGKPALSVRNDAAKPGDEVEVSVRVRGAVRGSLPVRVRVFRPDGVEETWPRRELLVENGRAHFTLQVAWNAMPGQWKLTARNIFTGDTAEATFVVGK